MTEFYRFLAHQNSLFFRNQSNGVAANVSRITMKSIFQLSFFSRPVIYFSFLISVLFHGLFLSAGQGQPAEVRYENFKIVYHLSDENVVREIIQILQEAAPVFEKFYQVKIEGLMTILLPFSADQFRHVSPPNLPVWSNGCFLARERTIILKKPKWSGIETPLKQILLHELAHAWFYERFENRQIPLWFQEGLAEYHSSQAIPMSGGILISNALFSGQLVELTDIDSLSMFSTGRARLAYLESLSAIIFFENLLNKNGMNWLNCLDAISNHDFETALHLSTGSDYLDFQWKWYRWLQEKYQWFIILNWENLVWLGMVVILIGAIYSIRYRNKKILMQWAEEEKSSGEDTPDNQVHLT